MLILHLKTPTPGTLPGQFRVPRVGLQLLMYLNPEMPLPPTPKCYCTVCWTSETFLLQVKLQPPPPLLEKMSHEPQALLLLYLWSSVATDIHHHTWAYMVIGDERREGSAHTREASTWWAASPALSVFFSNDPCRRYFNFTRRNY